MSKTFLFELVVPDKLVYSGSVEFVTAVGGLGEFTVLPGHTFLLTTIEPGIVRFSVGGSIKEYAVGYGYAEVRPDKMIMLVEFAVTEDEIDKSELLKQIKESEEKLYSSVISEAERLAYFKQLLRLKAKEKLANR
ncbi:MAG: ATP synthase F1 subunit epsilon [Thermosulfidibacteraceae bacterium]|jgi:F-type H+-transporting ATPase subunit epsilon